MCSKSRVEYIMHEFYGHMREIFGTHLREVILFGSYARDEAEEGSDIDVLVLTDLPRNELIRYRTEIAHIASEYLFSDDILLSAIVENADFFQRHIDVLPFYRNIDNEGVRISA